MGRITALCSGVVLAALISTSAEDTVAAGTWGGPHITLEVTEEGATAAFDCAHGRIAERMTLDRTGRFDVRGTYAVERPGPVRETEDDEGRAVRYAGRVTGKTMRLTISADGARDPLGTFTLEHGKSGAVRRCQ
jgi:hypothetical protein